ncbi:MAG: LON peptidase substrate-binding domain-containing protein [Candidatus Krumholzibacteriota bacterium]|nr:LON peptidase substrate-binding domain-containing protein [Candidatus Krumholzibacteriota bacterium]
MAGELEEMPLFPLHTVLFPYAPLHLHVFEPRYREMIGHCTQNDVGFGVVLIRDGEETGKADPYLVGTAVTIARVQTFDDGKLDVLVHGQRRFRVRRIDGESKPYLVGYVEPVVEMEFDEPDRANELAAALRENVAKYILGEFLRHDVTVQEISLPADPAALSFVIAGLLKIENIEKQRLLETVDTLGRISDMIPILEQHIADGRTSEERKASAQMLSEWITPN